MCLEDISLCACQRFLLSSFPCSQVYGVQHGRINAHENSSSSVCELAALLPRATFRRVARGVDCTKGARARCRGRKRTIAHARWELQITFILFLIWCLSMKTVHACSRAFIVSPWTGGGVKIAAPEKWMICVEWAQEFISKLPDFLSSGVARVGLAFSLQLQGNTNDEARNTAVRTDVRLQCS